MTVTNITRVLPGAFFKLCSVTKLSQFSVRFEREAYGV